MARKADNKHDDKHDDKRHDRGVTVALQGGRILGYAWKVPCRILQSAKKALSDVYGALSKTTLPSVLLSCMRIYGSTDHRAAFYYKGGVLDYCKERGFPSRILEDTERRTVLKPAFFELTQERRPAYQSPPVYMAEISNAIVVGGEKTVYADQYCLNDAISYDGENRVDGRSSSIKKILDQRILVEEPARVTNRIHKAIHLLGYAPDNYYHWLIEILSGLSYVDEQEAYADYPVLVDGKAIEIPQFKEALTVFNKRNRRVIPIDGGEWCRVDQLVFISRATWMPLNVYDRNRMRASDFMVSGKMLMNIRKTCTDYMKPDGNNKIFLSRKNLINARLTNEQSIKNLFVDAGFDVVCTETMSFKEQVEYFSQADIIVGSTGASMTNIVFGKPGATLVCIMPEEFHFYMYSTIADMVGMKCLFLNANITKKTPWPAADEFELDEKYTKRLIERIAG